MASYKVKLVAAERELARLRALSENLAEELIRDKEALIMMSEEFTMVKANLAMLEDNLRPIGYVRGSFSAENIKHRLNSAVNRLESVESVFSLFGYNKGKENEKETGQHLLSLHSHLGRVSHVSRSLLSHLNSIISKVKGEDPKIDLSIISEIPESPEAMVRFESLTDLTTKIILEKIKDYEEEVNEVDIAMSNLETAVRLSSQSVDLARIIPNRTDQIKKRISAILLRRAL